MMLQDREGAGYQALQGATFAMMGAAQQNPNVGQVFSLFNTGSPGSRPRSTATAPSCSASSRPVFAARHLSRLDLRQRFQPPRPHLPGDRAGRGGARDDLADIGRLQVRSPSGGMVPLSSVATFRYGTARSR